MTRHKSSGITPVLVLFWVTLTWSAPASGQTQPQASPNSDLQADRLAATSSTVSRAVEANTAAAAPSETAGRTWIRPRTVRNPARRSSKPVAKEQDTNLENGGPIPAANATDKAVAQATAEGPVDPASADASVASAPNENYPPDPTQASVVPTPATDIGPPKTMSPPQVEHMEPVAAGPDYSMLKAAGGFGLVLCLIALVYLGGRKLFPKYFTRNGTEKNLKLIETLAIGEKRSVAVIEFENQRLIIGNTPNQITLLTALPLRLALVEDSPTAPAASFDLSKSKVPSDTFRGLYEIEKTNGRGNRQAIPPDIQAKMRQLRESLEH